ncbi:MAG: hypothetical protein A2104_01820 [Candidatus Melainabacteria bacterium GWF2_32_7]|nr:MAG: hypothetical protein A2104_01820 [Candidatus Melainabacteria bacterium GWF2_32_7]
MNENVLSNKIQVVSIVNNFDTYNTVIRNNKNINHYSLTIFDNTSKNIGISTRYNSFINSLQPNDDSWIIFCHQDFGFMEDPLSKLCTLDKNFICGAVGAKLKRGLFVRNSKLFTYKRFFIGEIHQGDNSSDFRKNGKKLKKPERVETLDCCCIIVHSSLITRFNLRFDENLKFHMYAEDFCIYARKNFGIDTKVVQFECFHLGAGTPNDEYHESVEYVKRKYGLKKIISTCCD